MGDNVESDNITDRAECDRNIDQLAQMFKQYDREALADILQANGGNMEETISMLLSQSEGQNKPSHDELVSQKMQEESGILASPQSPPAAVEAVPEPSLSSEINRGKTISLKDDFLRPPGWRPDEEVEVIQKQVDADERLAMLLQNEDFLAIHPEFSQDTGNDPEAPSSTSETTLMGNIKSMGEGKWNMRNSKADAGDFRPNDTEL